jgi:hypothetical protein
MVSFLYLNRYRAKNFKAGIIYEGKVCTTVLVLRTGFSGQ